MAIIENIKLSLTAILLLGLLPYLWYRDEMGTKMHLLCFSVVFITWVCLVIEKPWPKNLPWIVLAIGASLNQIAIWANHGHMPVKASFTPHGLWRPMVESDRVKFLCDIYWNSTSIGDLIAVSGFVLFLIMSFVE